MKSIARMSLAELAAYIWSHLNNHAVSCVLSGGACVSFYSSNKYESVDLDFVHNVLDRKIIMNALAEIGFYEENRYFKHPDTRFIVEFLAGPLSVGSEPVKDIVTLKFSTGELALLSPTDCIKDRLSAYFHWDDLQSLEQAVMVAMNNEIDLKEIGRWSKVENKYSEYLKIRNRLTVRKSGRVRMPPSALKSKKAKR
ncbi:hypothetical protein JW906_08725 [bacterium]|nr:hypothetical protein [bacterium]